MADKITDTSKILTTQIQQKTETGMVALRPETQSDIVINKSTNITGTTVKDTFDNALPITGDGAINVSVDNNQLVIGVDQSKILPTGGQIGQVLTSAGSTTVWNTPSVASTTTDGVITINETAGSNSKIVQTYSSTNIDSKIAKIQNDIAAIDQFKYVISGNAADTPKGVQWYDGSGKIITGTLTASADTEFCIYLVPDRMGPQDYGIETGTYVEYMTFHLGSLYQWEPIGTTRVVIPEYTIANGDANNQIKLLKDGTAVGNAVTVNNVANATTATKLGSTTVGSSTKPIYLNNGTATECNNYAGGTAVTLNGSSKAASTAEFYAPTSKGTNNKILISNLGGVPIWSNWTKAGFLKTDNTGAVSIDTTTYAKSAKLTKGGTYSVVSYNTDGIVTAGGNIIKYYSKTATNPADDSDLVTGGFALIEI